jgi:hypothetical protein
MINAVAVVLTLLASTFTGAEAATPRTFYVNPAGNDSATGSATAPFKTLAKGVSVLLPGGQIQPTIGNREIRHGGCAD